ncbi:MAG: hypothetical protein JWL90_721 [Chthoniobacteraceae bacterium]|nr:hypothetical protein [Chthoniobacteraceae bacterium]
MKLRARFPRLQLLFLLGCILSSFDERPARADTVIPTGAGARLEGKVIGVNGNNLQVQRPEGILNVPLNGIKEVQMPVPPEFARAQNAFAAKDYTNALNLARALAEKYKGIPLDWAQQSTGMLGDLYIATKDLAKAEVAYKDFQRLYPNAGSLQTEVGMARIALSKKDFAFARKKLEPIGEAALKEKNITRSNGVAYSNAFLALGELKENDGDLPEALEDYLRTVTVFYYDPGAVAAAQERADALRARKISVP